MGHPKTQLSALQELHADLQALVGREVDRDSFHRMAIKGLGVGYPHVYGHIKTGVVLGLWVQVGGRNGPFQVLPPSGQTPSPQPSASPAPTG